jgi:hypothetical protein
LSAGSLEATQVRANVEWNAGVLQLKPLRAEVWDGRHRGELKVDLRRASPSYEWRGELQQVSMKDLGGAANFPWEGGTATLRGTGTAGGSTTSALLRSMNASVEIDWRDGLLNHPEWEPEAEPLTLRRFLGKAELRGGTFRIPAGALQLQQGKYEVSGVASRNGDLKFRLVRALNNSGSLPVGAVPTGAEAYRITGTLERPVVSVMARPQPEHLDSMATEIQDRADAGDKNSRIPLRPGR